ncbi:MAG: hypothetical protein HFJ80_05050 [Clostridiales bacterium]|nr:hypothetical protein [Clostridiales bacterium]
MMNEEILQGFPPPEKEEWYEDGRLRSSSPKEGEWAPEKDNKLIYTAGDRQRVVNFPDGYLLDVPAGWRPDFTLSPVRVRYRAEGLVLTVTREKMIYDTHQFFFDECFNRHIKDPQYRKENQITEVRPCHVEELDGYRAEFIHLHLEGMPEGSLTYYTFVKLYNESPDFFHFLLKTAESFDLEPVVRSLREIPASGTAVYSAEFQPHVSEDWTPETRAYYEKLKNADTIQWGLFTSHGNSGQLDQLEELEEKMDYRFPIVSIYRHVVHGFPTEAVQRVADAGRQLQFTYQYTGTNNTDLSSGSAALEVYRGKWDDRLREIARGIRDYGKPVLFRLNNEMNTDWTSYSGLVCLLDPDIFIETWIRFYNIFEEEGVHNAIWICNPFDKSFPPCRWASFINYMPPAEYMHLIGVTGYCRGHNGFPSFRKIYQKIEDDYRPFFMDWPWIISEFGCASGDGTQLDEQEEWLRGMFDCYEQGLFSNIKAAVWFSADDLNPDGSILNWYLLHPEQDQIMGAFRDGFKRTHAEAACPPGEGASV